MNKRGIFQKNFLAALGLIWAIRWKRHYDLNIEKCVRAQQNNLRKETGFPEYVR